MSEPRENNDTVLVFTSIQDESDYMGVADALRRGVSVPINVLEKNVDSFVRAMKRIVNGASQDIDEFDVSEIHIKAEITGAGEIGLTGVGGSVGGTAGIELVFDKR